MARSSSRVVSLVVTLAAAIMMLFPFQNAYSIHFDHPPDNPPPLEVRVDVREVRLLQDVEGLFMDGAELVMETSVEHKDHAVRRVVLQNPDVPDGGTWSVDTNVYTGNDCTPREDVKVDVKLVELDATTMEQIIFALTSTAAGAAAGAVVAAVTVVTAPVSVTIGAAVGLTISVIAIFGSGDDDLGSGSVTYPEGQAMGPRIMNLNGKDGRADVDIAGQSITLADTAVQPAPAPAASPAHARTKEFRDFRSPQAGIPPGRIHQAGRVRRRDRRGDRAPQDSFEKRVRGAGRNHRRRGRAGRQGICRCRWSHLGF